MEYYSIGMSKSSRDCDFIPLVVNSTVTIFSNIVKGAGASEAPGQTKEEFSANDTSRDPKVLKIGPQHG